MAASMPLTDISLELCVQSGAAISNMLDPNHEWKPEMSLFSSMG
jgi:hypothetical protein